MVFPASILSTIDKLDNSYSLVGGLGRIDDIVTFFYIPNQYSLYHLCGEEYVLQREFYIIPRFTITGVHNFEYFK